MPIKVLTFNSKDRGEAPHEQAKEVATQLNVWLEEHPGARVINIETILVRDRDFRAPNNVEIPQHYVRVWIDSPEGQG